MNSRIYFLSFRDPNKNLNQGVVIVHAKSKLGAVIQSRVLGLHPGGEVMVEQISKSELTEHGLKFNKLYSREEMIQKGYQIGIK